MNIMPQQPELRDNGKAGDMTQVNFGAQKKQRSRTLAQSNPNTAFSSHGAFRNRIDSGWYCDSSDIWNCQKKRLTGILCICD
jgi:hypothetical protein